MQKIHRFPISRNGHTVPALVPTALLPNRSAALPEAACSVNGYFHINGYADRFQATGRGHSAEEAAHNLAATIRATKATLETPPLPPSSEERLSALLACGLRKAVAKQDYELVCRLSKAAALVLSGAVEPGEREGMLAVRSQQDASQYYAVDGTQCSCPDWERHARKGDKLHCKHVLATMFWRRLEEQTQ
jgi:hypothetical protein